MTLHIVCAAREPEIYELVPFPRESSDKCLLTSRKASGLGSVLLPHAYKKSHLERNGITRDVNP